MRLRHGGATDTGRVRRNNEDYWQARLSASAAEEAIGAIFVVADGVGGQEAGELASRAAVEALIDSYYQADAATVAERLEQAVDKANQAVIETGGSDGRATTLVCAVIAGVSALVANVGDSRCYLVRAGAANQITLDHSWVQEQVRAGEIAPEAAIAHPQGNVITRWLGQPSVDADFFDIELRLGDHLVLCSDGLTRYASPEQIVAAVDRASGANAEQDSATALIELAKSAGGADNITAVVIGCHDEALPPASVVSPARASKAPSAPVLAGALGSQLLWRSGRAALVVALIAVLALGAYLGTDSFDGVAPLPSVHAGATAAALLVAISPSGRLAFANPTNGLITVYGTGAFSSRHARFLGMVPSPDQQWQIAPQNALPPVEISGIAFGPDDMIYVADGAANLIRVYSESGSLIREWGASGSGAGQLIHPSALAIGADGAVYVGDTGNHRVQRFAPTGELAESWGTHGQLAGFQARDLVASIAVTPSGVLYVLDSGVDRVLRFDASGSPLSDGELAPPDLTMPTGLAVDQRGWVYVLDRVKHKVLVVDPAGQTVATIGRLWPFGGNMTDPTAVAVDQLGSLYVLDSRGSGLLVIRHR